MFKKLIRPRRYPILYTDDSCPPCMAVQMTAKHLGLELDRRQLNILEREHLSPTFMKVNPLHCVPTLVDGTLTLCDSHAIMTYIATTYYGGKELYPDDLNVRAKIQQFLYFDANVLFARLRFLGSAVEPKDKIWYIYKGVELLEKALKDKDYLVTGRLTLADLSCASTMETLKLVARIPIDEYPSIDNWMKRFKELPYYELNEKCAISFEKMYRDALEENKSKT